MTQSLCAGRALASFSAPACTLWVSAQKRKRKVNANWRKGWSPKTPSTGPALVGHPSFEDEAQSMYAKPPEHRQVF